LKSKNFNNFKSTKIAFAISSFQQQFTNFIVFQQSGYALRLCGNAVNRSQLLLLKSVENCDEHFSRKSR
jgi:hypothetical protein